MANRIARASISMESGNRITYILAMYMDENHEYAGVITVRPQSDKFKEVVQDIKSSAGYLYWISQRKHTDGSCNITMEHMHYAINPSEFRSLMEETV